jgi:hypothetical protein
LLDLPIKKNSIKYNTNTKILKILDILIGTSRSTRLGPKPLPEALDIIGKRMKLKIQSELPINIPICFGCKKTWRLCQPGVDIAELFTILQLLKLNRQIQDIYPPGINFTLYLGDAWYEYIYNENIGIKEYRKGLKKLLNLNTDLNVKLISMHNFHKKDSSLYNTCDNNLAILKEYWNESSNIEEKYWQYLETYKKLKTLGWIGTIPNIMRMHYLKKMDRYLPKTRMIKKVEAILKFFSYGLMLNQNDIIKRQNPVDCTIEISLMSQPPGIPKRLRGDRLYLRALPPEISSRGAPCWPVMGILKLHENGSMYPSILSPRDWNQKNVSLVNKFEYTIDNKTDFSIMVPVYKTIN